MRVLLTGSGGLVGGRLAALLSSSFEVIGGRHRTPPPSGIKEVEMDLGRADSVEGALDVARPAAVLHAGALADPDACERDPNAAQQINTTASALLARICGERGLRLVALSTDLVFPGDRPFSREDDPPGPILLYGRTKLDAERRVLDACPAAAIARVALVYGLGHGPRGTASESVAWRLREGTSCPLFTRQVRTPVDTRSLAGGLGALLRGSQTGVFHFGGPERLSRYELGVHVAEILGLNKELLVPVESANQLVRRPDDVSLDSGRARRELGWTPLGLDEAIREGRAVPEGA